MRQARLRFARLQVKDQLGQGEGHEPVRDDVEAGRFVHLIRVERVEGARGPGRHRREAQDDGQPPSAEGGEQAGEADGHVRGQDGVPRRPDDRRDGQRGQQPVIGEGQRARVGKEDVGVEEMRGGAEELVHVPGDDVHALQRVADVGDRVARPQGLGQEADEDEDEVERGRDGGLATDPARRQSVRRVRPSAW